MQTRSLPILLPFTIVAFTLFKAANSAMITRVLFDDMYYLPSFRKDEPIDEERTCSMPLMASSVGK